MSRPDRPTKQELAAVNSGLLRDNERLNRVASEAAGKLSDLYKLQMLVREMSDQLRGYRSACSCPMGEPCKGCQSTQTLLVRMRGIGAHAPMTDNAIIVLAFPCGELRLCPTERIAIRERMLGRAAVGPNFARVLRDVHAIFPQSKIESMKGLKK